MFQQAFHAGIAVAFEEDIRSGAAVAQFRYQLLEGRPVELIVLFFGEEVIRAAGIGHEYPDFAVLIRHERRFIQRFFKDEFTKLDELVRLAEHILHRAGHTAYRVGDRVVRGHSANHRGAPVAVLMEKTLELPLGRRDFPHLAAYLLQDLYGFRDFFIGENHGDVLCAARPVKKLVKRRNSAEPAEIVTHARELFPQHVAVGIVHVFIELVSLEPVDFYSLESLVGSTPWPGQRILVGSSISKALPDCGGVAPKVSGRNSCNVFS